MPQFRLISEPPQVGFQLKDNVPRRLRGDASVRRVVAVVDAPDILAALQGLTAEHGDQSVISVEEIIPAIALYISDEELTELLMQDNDDTYDQEPLHPGDYDTDEVIFEAADFNTNVERVAAKLGERFLPGLFLTIVSNLDGDHALIQVRDEATGIYRTKTAAMDELSHDPEATGWQGILAIANAVIAQAQELV